MDHGVIAFAFLMNNDIVSCGCISDIAALHAQVKLVACWDVSLGDQGFLVVTNRYWSLVSTVVFSLTVRFVEPALLDWASFCIRVSEEVNCFHYWVLVVN